MPAIGASGTATAARCVAAWAVGACLLLTILDGGPGIAAAQDPPPPAVGADSRGGDPDAVRRARLQAELDRLRGPAGDTTPSRAGARDRAGPRAPITEGDLQARLAAARAALGYITVLRSAFEAALRAAVRVANAPPLSCSIRVQIGEFDEESLRNGTVPVNAVSFTSLGGHAAFDQAARAAVLSVPRVPAPPPEIADQFLRRAAEVSLAVVDTNQDAFAQIRALGEWIGTSPGTLQSTSRPGGPRASTGGGAEVGGTGTLDSREAARVVGRAMGGIKRCYESQLGRNPTLQGRITVTFTVNESGTVTAVTATESFDGDVGSCVAGIIRRLRFPPPDGGPLTYSFPFVFQPAVGQAPSPPPAQGGGSQVSYCPEVPGHWTWRDYYRLGGGYCILRP